MQFECPDFAAWGVHAIPSWAVTLIHLFFSAVQNETISCGLLAMASRVKTINLEDGMPTVCQARTRLIAELQIARRAGVAIVKIIHGYGSSGVGGDLRIALQATLRQMADRGEIRTCVFGENWRRGDEDAWALVNRFPDLKGDSDFDKRNNGITLVVL